MATTLFFLALSLAADPIDWPKLVQEPYEKLPIADLGLRPLLVDAGGKKFATPAEWGTARKALHDAWMARLGAPPEKPARLDVKSEPAHKLEGYSRQLVRFAAEGDDRIRAWLLVPD